MSSLRALHCNHFPFLTKMTKYGRNRPFFSSLGENPKISMKKVEKNCQKVPVSAKTREIFGQIPLFLQRSAVFDNPIFQYIPNS